MKNLLCDRSCVFGIDIDFAAEQGLPHHWRAAKTVADTNARPARTDQRGGHFRENGCFRVLFGCNYNRLRSDRPAERNPVRAIRVRLARHPRPSTGTARAIVPFNATPR